MSFQFPGFHTCHKDVTKNQFTESTWKIHMLQLFEEKQFSWTWWPQLGCCKSIGSESCESGSPTQTETFTAKSIWQPDVSLYIFQATMWWPKKPRKHHCGVETFAAEWKTFVACSATCAMSNAAGTKFKCCTMGNAPAGGDTSFNRLEFGQQWLSHCSRADCRLFENLRNQGDGASKTSSSGWSPSSTICWISGAWGAEVPLAARLSVAVQNRGGGHHFPGDDRRKWSNHANHGGYIPTARVLQQTPWPLCKGGVEHNGGKQISQPLPQEILHAQIGVESRQGFQHCLFAVHWRTPKVFSFFSSIGGSWGCRITAFQKCGGNNFLEKYIQRFIGYMKDVCNCKPMIVPCYVAVRQCKVRHWAMSYYDSDPWITTSKMMIES